MIRVEYAKGLRNIIQLFQNFFYNILSRMLSTNYVYKQFIQFNLERKLLHRCTVISFTIRKDCYVKTLTDIPLENGKVLAAAM